MTNAELIAEIERLDKAATPGWMIGVSRDGTWPVFRIRDLNDPSDENEIQANREFIERARELLLLAARRIAELEASGR